MKNLFKFAVIAFVGALAIGTTACGDDTGEGDGLAPVVDTRSLSFTAEGGIQTVAVAGEGWMVMADPWIKAEKTEDGKSFVVTVRPTQGAKNGKITVYNAAATVEIPVSQEALGRALTIDDMVGEWSVSGYQVDNMWTIDGVPGSYIKVEDRRVTITKIDDKTLEIADMLAIGTYFGRLTEANDTFRATFENGTLTIASQEILPGTSTQMDKFGREVYVCRWKYPESTPVNGTPSNGFELNWKTGFEKMAISDDMTIDFTEGGFQKQTVPEGMEICRWDYENNRPYIDPTLDLTGLSVVPTFTPLGYSENDTAGYNEPVVVQYGGWYYFNTVWHKEPNV